MKKIMSLLLVLTASLLLLASCGEKTPASASSAAPVSSEAVSSDDGLFHFGDEADAASLPTVDVGG